MPSPQTPSHYELLQLPATASAQELRRAFRSLSKRYHPDTTDMPPREAEQAFRSLQQAYAVLSDPQARLAYDRQLFTPAPPPPVSLRAPVAAPRPASVRRALSGGEWFALLLLGVALVLSLVLGIGVAWARGAQLVQQPSWWNERQVPPPVTPPSPAEVSGVPAP